MFYLSLNSKYYKPTTVSDDLTQYCRQNSAAIVACGRLRAYAPRKPKMPSQHLIAESEPVQLATVQALEDNNLQIQV
jgi:hypothetical protein